ncbi:hypothetical protein Tco_0286752 [Tanacetum coccineum]
MGAGSTSNSQFPGFSSQAPMTPEQQAFFESQQAAFVAFQQDFQNRQQNPPQFEMPQQQSQSSNSLSQTESQPKKGRMKRTAKKGKSSEPIGDVTLRWTSDEETLLAECFVAVSEDPNVGRSQPRDTLWYRVLNEFNRLNFQKRTKDMLSSKWSTLNHHCQKFNAIYKRCNRLKKSGENEVDLMKRARGIYQDENKNSSFNHEKAWAVLRKHAKWDAPDPAPVDLTEDENVHDEHVPAVNTDELFGPDPRPRPPGKQRPGKKTKSDTSASTGGSNSSSQFDDFMSHELRLKREAAEKAFETSKDQDRTITRLEEWRFLSLSTKDLSPDDAYWINLQKKQIKDKLRAQMPRDSNNQSDDSDEYFFLLISNVFF